MGGEGGLVLRERRNGWVEGEYLCIAMALYEYLLCIEMAFGRDGVWLGYTVHLLDRTKVEGVYTLYAEHEAVLWLEAETNNFYLWTCTYTYSIGAELFSAT